MLFGENINLGVGLESTRGTAVAPQAFIPARVPTGIKVENEKTTIKETKGSRINSQGSTISSTRVEGDLEFNVRNNSVGYLLKSLLGSVTTTSPETDVYEHDFEVDASNPQNPSLTLALSQLGKQDYETSLAVVSSMEFTIPADDMLYAVASFIAKEQAEHSDYSVAFADNDYKFDHYHATIKIADSVSDLANASGECLNELSLSITNNARPRLCLSSKVPTDIIGLVFDINGSFSKDYIDKTFYDVYKSGAYKAMEITLENTDVTIGSSSHPKISFVLPKVSFESYDRDLAIDEIAKETIGFQAHFDNESSKAIEVKLVNETASY